MKISTRLIMLMMVAGAIAMGGLIVGCDNNNQSNNNPTANATPTATPPTQEDSTTSANNGSDNTSTENTSNEGTDTQATPTVTSTESATTNDDDQTNNTDNQTNTTPTGDDEIPVLIGDSLIEVDKLEIRQGEVGDNEEGIRLDDWLQKQIPEASRSIIRRWLREGRRVSVNEELITQASYPLAPADKIAYSFTEFSALKIHVTELLTNPAREEYDLFLLTITGQYIQDNHIQYLGVGPLFERDINGIPEVMKGKDGLPNWQRAFLTAELGEYRFYELD